jgi:hypothetical protein
MGRKHKKSGAGSQLAVYLDTVARIVNHAFDHVEADARALDVVVKALEHGTKLGQLGQVEAQPVVVHFQHHVARPYLSPHRHVQ